MPKDLVLRSLFVKHFCAKAFRWTPQETEMIPADELDALVLIEHTMNDKRSKEQEAEIRKNKMRR